MLENKYWVGKRRPLGSPYFERMCLLVRKQAWAAGSACLEAVQTPDTHRGQSWPDGEGIGFLYRPPGP